MTSEHLAIVYTSSGWASEIFSRYKNDFDFINAKSLMVDPDMCVAFRGEQPVAFAPLMIDRGVQRIHIEFLEVAKSSRHDHIGSRVLHDIFRYANEMPGQGRPYITTCGFTMMGRKYMLPLIDRLAVEYPRVEFASIQTA